MTSLKSMVLFSDMIMSQGIWYSASVQRPFDSAAGNHFTVHTDEGNYKFNCSEEGLYYFEFSDKYKSKIGHKTSLVTTVAENRSHYTTKQFEKAKEVREWLQTHPQKRALLAFVSDDDPYSI